MTTNKVPPLRRTENTKPTLRGAMGDAWLIDIAALHSRHGVVNDPRTAVMLPCWIASAAYAHPVWSHYAIHCISLRDVPGVPKAVINLEGATHEIMVFALDPDTKPTVNDYPRLLQPANFVAQFIAVDDLAAAAYVQQAVQEVIDGTLNPDTDNRGIWVQRFSGSNLKPGALEPDFIVTTPGAGMVVHGMGASNVRAVQQIVHTSATLGADETKPQ
jgi:hypothetical protein